MCNTSRSLWSQTSVGKYCPRPQQWKLLIINYYQLQEEISGKAKYSWKKREGENYPLRASLFLELFRSITPRFKFELRQTPTNTYLHWIKARHGGKKPAWKPRRSSSELAGLSPKFSFCSGTPGTGSCWRREAAAPQGMFCFQSYLGSCAVSKPWLALQWANFPPVLLVYHSSPLARKTRARAVGWPHSRDFLGD